MENGRITHYLHLERWTRQKYDNQMHLHLERFFDEELIPIKEDAALVFVNSYVGNSFITPSGRIRFEQMARSTLTADLIPGKAWLELKKRAGKEYHAYAIDHELAHVCANLPFHGGFRDNALLVQFDGMASLGNFSAFVFRNGKIGVLECHRQLAHLSQIYNHNALAFALLNHPRAEHCGVAGKLMGFATLRDSIPEIEVWLRTNDFFKDCWSDKSAFYEKARSDFGWSGVLGDTRDPFLQEIAAAFQGIFVREWVGYLQKLQERVRADYLYLSGGCALNIVANTRIVDHGMFQEVFMPPCPGDSGLSIGAAAFAEWKKHGTVERHSPFLNNTGLEESPFRSDPELVRQTAQAIADGMVVGVANGAAETGPRALGNRSILARPDSCALAERVSMECKEREWYRPIAPVMLEKNVRQLTGLERIPELSKYMLLDFFISEPNRTSIAGVVHANGTSRIQTLFARDDNPFIWDVLVRLDEVHGIAALINTSFNRRGEPIVHTPEQALESARVMALDAAVINYRYRTLEA